MTFAPAALSPIAPPAPPARGPCSSGCGRPAFARGWCRPCYLKRWKAGTVAEEGRRLPEDEWAAELEADPDLYARVKAAVRAESRPEPEPRWRWYSTSARDPAPVVRRRCGVARSESSWLDAFLRSLARGDAA